MGKAVKIGEIIESIIRVERRDSTLSEKVDKCFNYLVHVSYLKIFCNL